MLMSSSVKEATREKHVETCLAHVVDFAPFGFCALRSFRLTIEDNLTQLQDILEIGIQGVKVNEGRTDCTFFQKRVIYTN